MGKLNHQLSKNLSSDCAPPVVDGWFFQRTQCINWAKERICGTFEQHPVSINLVYPARTSRHQHVCCLNATFLCCDLFFPSSSLLEREPSVSSSSPVMQIKTCPWWWQVATGQASTNRRFPIAQCSLTGGYPLVD